MMNYPELVATLPVPTPEQTARFAEYVVDNHSWYKHLPFFMVDKTVIIVGIRLRSVGVLATSIADPRHCLMGS